MASVTVSQGPLLLGGAGNAFDCEAGQQRVDKQAGSRQKGAAVIISGFVVGAVLGVMLFFMVEPSYKSHDGIISFDIGCIRDHLSAHAKTSEMIADCEVKSHGHVFSKSFSMMPSLRPSPVVASRTKSDVVMRNRFNNKKDKRKRNRIAALRFRNSFKLGNLKGGDEDDGRIDTSRRTPEDLDFVKEHFPYIIAHPDEAPPPSGDGDEEGWDEEDEDWEMN